MAKGDLVTTACCPLYCATLRWAAVRFRAQQYQSKLHKQKSRLLVGYQLQKMARRDSQGEHRSEVGLKGEQTVAVQVLQQR